MKRALPWRILARDNQREPAGDWLVWLILAGRGFGKTRTGAEWVSQKAHDHGFLILAGATASDLRDVMIEGESGVIRIAKPDWRPRYEPSKARLTWPNGATAILMSADEPDRFRGKQSEVVWADELAAWRYPDAWDQLLLGLRLGPRPRALVTTTPRPTRLIQSLVAAPTTRTVRGSSYDNRDNLAPDFLDQIISRYEGTRLGRQEIYAEILTDVPGALVSREMIRYGEAPLTAVNGVVQPTYTRVVVAIDPAVSYGPDSDETGIVVCAKGIDGRGYVLDDLSGRYSPGEWARKALAASEEYRADAIVGEVNNGGDLVEANLRNNGFGGRYLAVHASRGKRVRAEPIAGLYEQGKVSHRRPLADLEDQWCNFTPDSLDSPDRLDACVWGMTELFPPVQVIAGDFVFS